VPALIRQSECGARPRKSKKVVASKSCIYVNRHDHSGDLVFQGDPAPRARQPARYPGGHQQSRFHAAVAIETSIWNSRGGGRGSANSSLTPLARGERCPSIGGVVASHRSLITRSIPRPNEERQRRPVCCVHATRCILQRSRAERVGERSVVASSSDVASYRAAHILGRIRFCLLQESESPPTIGSAHRVGETPASSRTFPGLCHYVLQQIAPR
jgi:hypothetical protein